jgi:regulator of RNase E activity RraA
MSLDAETRALLGKVSVSTLTTCLYRRGLHNVWLAGLRPVSPTQPRLVGEAFTLRFIPSREDIGGPSSYGQGPNLHQRAFEECPQNHVLVMDTHDETRCCCCGDLLIARLRARGVAGIVSDGGFRDAVDVAALNFPAYQRQTAPSPSFLHLHAVELNGPIACAGIAVYPRDVMVGDSEGVVVIPAKLAPDIAREAWDYTQYDEYAAAQITAGHTAIGLYPATDASKAAFTAWRNAKCETTHE